MLPQWIIAVLFSILTVNRISAAAGHSLFYYNKTQLETLVSQIDAMKLQITEFEVELLRGKLQLQTEQTDPTEQFTTMATTTEAETTTTMVPTTEATTSYSLLSLQHGLHGGHEDHVNQYRWLELKHQLRMLTESHLQLIDRVHRLEQRDDQSKSKSQDFIDQRLGVIEDKLHQFKLAGKSRPPSLTIEDFQSQHQIHRFPLLDQFQETTTQKIPFKFKFFTSSSTARSIFSSKRIFTTEFVDPEEETYSTTPAQPHIAPVIEIPHQLMYDMDEDQAGQCECLRERFRTLIEPDPYQPLVTRLPLPVLLCILSSHWVTTDSEDNLARTALAWTAADAPRRSLFLPELLSHIRFAELSDEYYNSTLRNDQLILGCGSNCTDLFSEWDAVKAHLSGRFNTRRRSRRNAGQEVILAVGGSNGTRLATTEMLVGGASGRWRFVRSLPEPREEFSAGVINNYFYLVGGVTDQGKVATGLRYDALINKWDPIPDMPSGPRSRLGVGVHQSFLYAAGGSTKLALATDIVERFDPTTNEWTRVAPMRTSRLSPALCSYRGALVALGGAGDYYNERYLPASNKWVLIAPNITPKTYGACAVSITKRWDGTNQTELWVGAYGVLERYNATTDKWTVVGPHKSAAGSLGMGRFSFAMLTWEGSWLWALGGGGLPNAAGDHLGDKSVSRFRPKNAVDQLTEARERQQDGDVEREKLKSEVWIPGPPMQTARGWFGVGVVRIPTHSECPIN